MKSGSKRWRRGFWAASVLAVLALLITADHLLMTGCQPAGPAIGPHTANQPPNQRPSLVDTGALPASPDQEKSPVVEADPPKPKGPCERIDQGDSWNWGEWEPVESGNGYAYQAPISLQLDGQLQECPPQARSKIVDAASWREAWQRNHPRWKRAPARKFKPEWQMTTSLEPPLLQLTQGAYSVGLPHAGSIEKGIHPPLDRPGDYPYYLDRGPERSGFSSYALESMVVAMQQSLLALGETYQGLQFVILDASLLEGGVMPRISNPDKAHGSHQSGRDVDVAIALYEPSTKRFYWGHRERNDALLNRDSTLNRFAARVGLPPLRQLAKEIRAQDRKKKKRRKKRKRKRSKKKKRLSPLQKARIVVDEKLHRFVYDAIWQVVWRSWMPGRLRWAFLDRPQQRKLVAAAKRAGHAELADLLVAYSAKKRKYRRHSVIRCLYQPGEKGHDRHIHLRYNCAPDAPACED